MAAYLPYPKQLEFHRQGIEKRERALLAGNQLGKTLAAGYETQGHATGEYPPWWPGRKFHRPTKCWVANTNNETTRDNPQRVLLGEPGQWGTGMIPRSSIVKPPTMARGFPDLVDHVQVRHASGGISVIQFKAYEQGRLRWQGSTLDFIWYDEEPPDDVYQEGLARITATGGMTFMTMTPLLGMSDVVAYFYPAPSNPTRGLVMMDIQDAGHLDEEERAIVVAGYKPHERDARSRGIPLLGSGKIFDIPQSQIEVAAFDVPNMWPTLGGVDFGYGDHPFAGVKVSWDRDNDVLYMTHEYKEPQAIPSLHASSLKHWGESLRFAWPHDGLREWGESSPMVDLYRDEGLRMLAEHSTFKRGGYSTEAVVELLRHRMQTGRFKAFKHLDSFWQEVSTYHRKDGLLVKERDDILSALYKCVMMLRFARIEEGVRSYEAFVQGDFDPFAEDYGH